MTTYIEYQLDDDATLLIEVNESETNVVKVAQDDGNVIVRTNKKFRESLKSAKLSSLALLDELKDLQVDEMEITFGLKSTGEAGIFAIGKLGMETNFEVKLKWKKAE